MDVDLLKNLKPKLFLKIYGVQDQKIYAKTQRIQNANHPDDQDWRKLITIIAKQRK